MRLKHLHPVNPSRGSLVGVALVLVFVAGLLPARVAVAGDSNRTSEQVAAEILRVEASADDVAREWALAHQRSDELVTEIRAAESRVGEASARFDRLQAGMAQIAVDRFTGRSGETILVLGGNAVEAMQRDALRGFAMESSAADLDTVDAVRRDLENERAHLDALTTENTQVLKDLASTQTEIDARLAELTELRTHLEDEEVRRDYEAQLAEQREAAREEAERAALAAAEQAAATTAPPARGSGSSPRPVSGSPGSSAPTPPPTPPSAPAPVAPAPVVPAVASGPWLCPVAGPNAFGDTWGAPRSGGRTHQGVDMMSPFGTPLVAVVAGSVTMKTNNLGGNVVWLTGVDGNKYYYAHLSSWEGGSRSVAAGEVVGYVGATGSTSANHLHFEIHPGGGAAVNPFPTVRQFC